MLVSVVTSLLLLIAIKLSITVLKRRRKYNSLETSSNKKQPCKASKYRNAAVAADAEICSKVGRDILFKNGSAADAAIASMLCAGVINLHSCGIGGGSFMAFYERKSKKVHIYDFRESAPLSANVNMYVNQPDKSQYGGLAIGIPGQVKGMYHVHQKHGKLPWSQLFDAAIKLAEDGFKVTKPVATVIQYVKDNKYLLDGIRELITKEDGTFLEEGDLLRNPALAKTLRLLQKNPTSFYDGELAKKIVEDINDASGNVSLEDLKNYKVIERDSLTLELPNGLTLNTIAAPGGGPIIAMILNIMSGFDWSKTNLSRPKDQVEFYQKFIESMKFSYAQRGLLGDPDFLPSSSIADLYKMVSNLTVGEIIRDKISMTETHEPSFYGGTWSKPDRGTSHLSILAENGDAVSVTSTIYDYFGSLVRSRVTGIIYNDEMHDFNTPGTADLYGYPPSPANFIKPGKRPLSSMSPCVLLDQGGDVKMVVGASGGSKIIAGVAEVIAKRLFLHMPLCEAVGSYRLYHEGVPNEIVVFKEIAPPDDLVNRLKQIGHQVKEEPGMQTVVQAIYKDGETIYAMSDPRKYSKSAGY